MAIHTVHPLGENKVRAIIRPKYLIMCHVAGPYTCIADTAHTRLSLPSAASSEQAAGTYACNTQPTVRAIV